MVQMVNSGEQESPVKATEKTPVHEQVDIQKAQDLIDTVIQTVGGGLDFNRQDNTSLSALARGFDDNICPPLTSGEIVQATMLKRDQGREVVVRYRDGHIVKIVIAGNFGSVADNETLPYQGRTLIDKFKGRGSADLITEAVDCSVRKISMDVSKGNGSICGAVLHLQKAQPMVTLSVNVSPKIVEAGIYAINKALPINSQDEAYMDYMSTCLNRACMAFAA